MIENIDKLRSKVTRLQQEVLAKDRQCAALQAKHDALCEAVEVWQKAEDQKCIGAAMQVVALAQQDHPAE